MLAPKPVAEALAGYVSGPTRGDRVAPSCRIEVDRDRRTWSFGPGGEGFAARAWLYAARHYGVHTTEPLGTLVRVSGERPPSAWEIARSRAIGFVQNGRAQDVTIEASGGMQ